MASLRYQCSICLSDFDLSSDVASLPCGHLFHWSCVEEWIGRNPTCPTCRSRAIAPEIQRVFLPFVERTVRNEPGIVQMLESSRAGIENLSLNRDALGGSGPPPGASAGSGPGESHPFRIDPDSTLVHAIRCEAINCPLSACHAMKSTVWHSKSCPQRTTLSCGRCRDFMALCFRHAGYCRVAGCPVPYCDHNKYLMQQGLQPRIGEAGVSVPRSNAAPQGNAMSTSAPTTSSAMSPSMLQSQPIAVPPPIIPMLNPGPEGPVLPSPNSFRLHMFQQGGVPQINPGAHLPVDRVQMQQPVGDVQQGPRGGALTLNLNLTFHQPPPQQ